MWTQKDERILVKLKINNNKTTTAYSFDSLLAVPHLEVCIAVNCFSSQCALGEKIAVFSLNCSFISALLCFYGEEWNVLSPNILMFGRDWGRKCHAKANACAKAAEDTWFLLCCPEKIYEMMESCCKCYSKRCPFVEWQMALNKLRLCNWTTLDLAKLGCARSPLL